MRLLRLLRFLLLACLVWGAGRARAGGYDTPDNGTEALGRGGAFVAKSDDGTALYYNIAGLARQRGTRVTVDANFVLHDIAFTRDGVYPGDPTDARTPWAGQRYPTMHDGSSLFTVPYLGLSTDFGYFKRWTFGFGIYGPPGVGRHNYGVADQNTSEVATVKLANGMTAPAPTRYDISRTDLLIILPTLGVAVSPMKWLDLGLAAQLVYGHFDLANANVTGLGPTLCPSRDSPPCDAYGNIKSSGTTWGMLLSAMVHPAPWMDIGLTYRPQIDIHTEGSLHPSKPPAFMGNIDDAQVTFNSFLPHMLRAGGRLVSRYADGTERADVEIDGTYENWSNQNDRWGRPFDEAHYPSPNDPAPPYKEPYNDGPVSFQPDTIHAKLFKNGPSGALTAALNHAYRDTVSVRIGGAYNYRLSDTSRLIGRIGGYFDSAATHYEHTRLDFNTAAKYALTLGAGYKYRGITVNVAYAYIYSPSRNVTNSAVTAVDSLSGTDYAPGYQQIVIGNGLYEPSTHILSLGLSFNFSELRRGAGLMPN